MPCKRSAALGAVTLYVALATCEKAAAHGYEHTARLGGDHGPSVLNRRVGMSTVAARRGFGSTGRKIGGTSGE